MKVKCFDEEHENDLSDAVNAFIENKKIIDIKFSNACFKSENEQIFCFSALVIYEE